MKSILFASLCLTAFLHAACEPDDPNAPDLFRKCEQVYAINTEFLYWMANEGALDYGLIMQHPNAGSSPTYAQGNFQKASYDLDPGLRVALVFYRAPHYWEVKWQYTWIALSGNNTSYSPNSTTNFLTGTWPQVTTNPLVKIESGIHMNYNLFDWQADRVFIPNPHLRLRYLGGASVAWLNQNWRLQYFDALSNGTIIRNKWSFIGAGLKTGTLVDWYCGWDIYLTGGGTFGLFIGSYKNEAYQKATFQQTPGDNPDVPIRDANLSDVRPALLAQASIGPSWQKNYSKSRIEIFAGYEINSWFNLQEIYRSTSGSASAAKETWINTSAMTLQGLTFRMTNDF